MPIVGAPVVGIAEAVKPTPATVTCGRCHGVCSAQSRFCKYCGAPLGTGASVAPGTTEPGIKPDTGDEDFVEPDASISLVPEVPNGALVLEPSPTFHAGAQPAKAPSASSSGPATSRPKPPPPPSSRGKSVPAPAIAEPAPASRLRPESAPTRSDGAESPKASPIAEAAARTFVGSARIEGTASFGKLVVLVEDGSEGRSFDLQKNQVDVGRTEGDITLLDDDYVSPRHARLFRVDGRWFVRDLGSTNGVYARLRGPQALERGDLILLGLQVLEFLPVSVADHDQPAVPRRGAIQHGTRLFGSKPVQPFARLDQRTIDGVVGDVYHLFRDETFIGRELGDIVFTADPFLSRRHASIRVSGSLGGRRYTLQDLGSSNGTYLAIRRDTEIHDGDRIRVGQHLFRVDLPETATASAESTSSAAEAGASRAADALHPPRPGGVVRGPKSVS